MRGSFRVTLVSVGFLALLLTSCSTDIAQSSVRQEIRPGETQPTPPPPTELNCVSGNYSQTIAIKSMGLFPTAPCIVTGTLYTLTVILDPNFVRGWPFQGWSALSPGPNSGLILISHHNVHNRLTGVFRATKTGTGTVWAVAQPSCSLEPGTSCDQPGEGWREDVRIVSNPKSKPRITVAYLPRQRQ